MQVQLIHHEEMNAVRVKNQLTKAELQILQMLADGINEHSVCDRLMIDESTLSALLENIFVKFDVKSVNQAVVVAVHKRLVTSVFIEGDDDK